VQPGLVLLLLERLALLLVLRGQLLAVPSRAYPEPAAVLRLRVRAVRARRMELRIWARTRLGTRRRRRARRPGRVLAPRRAGARRRVRVRLVEGRANRRRVDREQARRAVLVARSLGRLVGRGLPLAWPPPGLAR